MWDGDRVVLCGGLCWPGWTAMVRKDQMKSGQDELSSQRRVDVLDQKVGNKIDLIWLEMNEVGPHGDLACLTDVGGQLKMWTAHRWQIDEPELAEELSD